MTEILLIRADADDLMGSGHVMRTLAIAEAASEKGLTCRFAMKACPDGLRTRLTRSGFSIDDLPQGDELSALLALIEDISPRAMVIDGYEFDESYRRAVQSAAAPVLTMDDGNSAGALYADLVVNANPAACANDYAGRAAGARLLLGPDFALLRREFLDALAAPSGPPVSERSRVLVTFGGSDPLRLSKPVTDGLLAALPGEVMVDLVLGGDHPDHETLAECAARNEKMSLHVNSTHMASLMATAGLAVSAAGSTSLELAAMGVPAVLAVAADNQAQVLRAHEALEWCNGLDARDTGASAKLVDMAIALWTDKTSRQAMADKAGKLIDGKGAERVVAALLEITNQAP